MKKLLPYLRLALFCMALFGISGLAMLLKQGRLLQKKATETSDASGGDKPDGHVEAAASLAGVGGGAATNGAGPGAKPAEGGAEAARSKQALATGRALFQVPEPISIAEATELLNDLQKQKRENDLRKAALDQRERDLDGFEKELEERRNELLAMAEKLNAAAPAASGDAGAAEELDPAVLEKVAKMLEGSLPEVAAKVLVAYSPDRAARILLGMKESKAAAVLGAVEPEHLQKITDALLRQKSSAE